MKLIAKPIEVIASFQCDGTIRPLRFRFLNEKETWMVIKVNQIIAVDHEKKAGIPTIIFRCQSDINGNARVYELKFERSAGMWTLYKI